MLLLIDNYDSFTYNLVHALGGLGAEVEVRRNDALSVEDALAMGAEAIVISPGPATPDSAGICLDLVRRAPETLPILGVCLGHQVVGQAFGGRIIRAPTIMHGKLSAIRHQGSGVFAGAPNPLEATRYHSLIVERASLPDALEITAETDDGVIMGLSHRARPVHSVQFHPESIRTPEGPRLLAAFLALAGVALPGAARRRAPEPV
ncbi:aminodeoxychorismate/anthranilate synthase component II [Pikeienuella sp. HZG-20]|uniref:anthranilate synthase component II n=1 Tax=Paludibacillus litoralis TaxID=3133267 RepID=UPI0030EF17DE